MKKELILLLLSLKEMGIVSSITVTKTMIIIRIKNNRPFSWQLRVAVIS